MVLEIAISVKVFSRLISEAILFSLKNIKPLDEITINSLLASQSKSYTIDLSSSFDLNFKFSSRIISPLLVAIKSCLFLDFISLRRVSLLVSTEIISIMFIESFVNSKLKMPLDELIAYNPILPIC